MIEKILLSLFTVFVLALLISAQRRNFKKNQQIWENKQERTFESRARKKTIAGIIFCWIGLTALGYSAAGLYNAEWWFIIPGPIGILFIIIGILYFISAKRDYEI